MEGALVGEEGREGGRKSPSCWFTEQCQHPNSLQKAHFVFLMGKSGLVLWSNSSQHTLFSQFGTSAGSGTLTRTCSFCL